MGAMACTLTALAAVMDTGHRKDGGDLPQRGAGKGCGWRWHATAVPVGAMATAATLTGAGNIVGRGLTPFVFTASGGRLLGFRARLYGDRGRRERVAHPEWWAASP